MLMLFFERSAADSVRTVPGAFMCQSPAFGAGPPALYAVKARTGKQLLFAGLTGCHTAAFRNLVIPADDSGRLFPKAGV